MAKTTARTNTKTFARINLLASQISIFLRRTTSISQRRSGLIQKGIKQKWIKKIYILGLDEKQLCRVQLVLDIDWDEHHYQLSLGKETVIVDKNKWKNETAIEVDEAIILFNDFVKEAALSTEWRVSYSDWVREDSAKKKEVQKELELVTASPVTWAGNIESGVIPKIPELVELGIEFKFTQ